MEVGDVLEAADAELYDDNEFEEEEEASKAYAPQAPEGKRRGMSRADILKEAAHVVKIEDDRAADTAFAEVGIEIRKSREGLSRDKDEEDEEDDDVDYGDGKNLTDADKELQFACYNGKPFDVRRALNNGGSIVKKDKHGWLPLHWAAAHGHDQIIDLLLDPETTRKTSIDTEKKKLNYINAQEDLTGFTPLHLSSIGGYLKCLDVLLSSGADHKIKNYQGESASEMLTIKLSKKEAASNLGHHVLIRLNPDLLKISENIVGKENVEGVRDQVNNNDSSSARK